MRCSYSTFSSQYSPWRHLDFWSCSGKRFTKTAVCTRFIATPKRKIERRTVSSEVHPHSAADSIRKPNLLIIGVFKIASVVALNTFDRLVTTDARSRVHALELNHLIQSDFGMSLAFSMSNGTEIPNGDCTYDSHSISIVSTAKWSFCSLR